MVHVCCLPVESVYVVYGLGMSCASSHLRCMCCVFVSYVCFVGRTCVLYLVYFCVVRYDASELSEYCVCFERCVLIVLCASSAVCDWCV